MKNDTANQMVCMAKYPCLLKIFLIVQKIMNCDFFATCGRRHGGKAKLWGWENIRIRVCFWTIHPLHTVLFKGPLASKAIPIKQEKHVNPNHPELIHFQRGLEMLWHWWIYLPLHSLRWIQSNKGWHFLWIRLAPTRCSMEVLSGDSLVEPKMHRFHSFGCSECTAIFIPSNEKESGFGLRKWHTDKKSLQWWGLSIIQNFAQLHRVYVFHGFL